MGIAGGGGGGLVDGTVNGKPQKVKCIKFTGFDGTKIDIPLPPDDAPEAVKSQHTPFTIVDPLDDNLPQYGYPITTAARMARYACPDGNYKWFAEDLGVPVETVHRWVKDGLDWKKQTYGRDKVPIRPGDQWRRSPTDVRMMALCK